MENHEFNVRHVDGLIHLLKWYWSITEILKREEI